MEGKGLKKGGLGRLGSTRPGPRELMSTYILAHDHTACTRRSVVGAHVLVHTPIAVPRAHHTRLASGGNGRRKEDER